MRMICGFLLTFLSTFLLAKPIHLPLKSGKGVMGEIIFRDAKSVGMRMKDGREVVIAREHLTESGQRMVKFWSEPKAGKKVSLQVPDSAFSKPWPRTVYGPRSIETKTRGDLTKRGYYVYESKHYRYISDSKLESKVVRRFATLFETTYKYVMALPLNATAKYEKRSDKWPIYLFGSFASYYRAGGPEGSVGVYIPSAQAVLVPLPVLGVRWRGGKWVYVKDYSNLVLSHELTHQLTGGVRYSPWYVEGSAEYVANTRYTHGVFHVTGGRRRTFSYVKAKKGLSDGSGRRLGARVPVMSLREFMNLPYSRFVGVNANRNYGIGLLLTYYFYHEDGRKDGAAIKRYIKARQQGLSEGESQQELLAGRSYEEIQEKFRIFCAQGGISLEFSKS